METKRGKLMVEKNKDLSFYRKKCREKNLIIILRETKDRSMSLLDGGCINSEKIVALPLSFS